MIIFYGTDEKSPNLESRETLYFLKGHVHTSKMTHICRPEISNWRENSNFKIRQIFIFCQFVHSVEVYNFVTNWDRKLQQILG